MASVDFTFTGASQAWTVPAGVTQVMAELWGASSGQATGGYRRVLLTVTPGESLQINVGEGGRNDGTAAFNGGAPVLGAGGSDVRRGGTDLASRVAVAGGAGGLNNATTGDGGAATGQVGVGSTTRDGFSTIGGYGGQGGTQSAGGTGGIGTTNSGTNGSLGAGGTGGNGVAGGGGGGWYGGGGGGYGRRVETGAEWTAGGGGGSNGGSVTGSAVQADQRGVPSPDGTKNGFVRFSYGTAVTAAADQNNYPPRVALSVVSVTAATVTIVRVDATTGERSNVRSANPATLTGGTWPGYDYEMPFNRPVYYIATGNDGSTSQSATVMVAASQPWLMHPGNPALSMPVTVERRGERTRPTGAQAHQPLGRKTPIVISDGRRRAEIYDLVVRTDNVDVETALSALLDDTSTLLLQIVYPGVTRSTYDWVSVGDVTVAEKIEGYYGSASLVWTLPCTVTVAPSGLLQSQWTWTDAAATYPTWNDFIAAYPTWTDAITNNPVT